jgi:signal transduction histidine kinase
MRCDGSEFPAEVAVVQIGSDGAPSFTGYIRDITERRRAAEVEMMRRAKEAAEAANVELEAFSYSVAHDLRAPLRAIAGFSQALVEDVADLLDPEAHGYLNRITNAAVRMGQLIDGLLALARISRSELQRERVDLGSLARSIVQRFDTSREVIWSLGQGVIAHGDPRLLHSLLDNLLGNAWKFTRDRAPATIELGAIERDGTLAYFVKDNGIGFDMAHARTLFAPFHRLHNELDFEGTGIGLATADRIVRRHGGRIWAESTPGQGTTFYFTLWRSQTTREIAQRPEVG